VIEIESLPVVPWKNGGGSTRNLAVEPAHAGFENFVWRVSVADVARPGAFSLFPGVDRILVPLSGGGMQIDRGKGAEVLSPFVPLSFRGEESIQAALPGGATRDLNVMVRRGLAEAIVEVWRGDVRLGRDADEAVFVCARGAFLIDGDRLAEGQATRRSGLRADTALVSSLPDSVLIGAMIRRIGDAA